MENTKYYIEISFSNGHTFHLKVRDFEKIRDLKDLTYTLDDHNSSIKRTLEKDLSWKDIKDYCIMVKSQEYTYSLLEAQITLKEVK